MFWLNDNKKHEYKTMDTVDSWILQKTMSELISAADTPHVVDVEAESSVMSDVSNNGCTSELVEHRDNEPMQFQPAVLPGLEEETLPGRDETPDAGITEKSEVEVGDVVDEALIQPSAPITSQLTAVDVSEQLAMLHDTVKSLKTSNDELRQIVSDGMTKVEELEGACAKNVSRNKELELELARLSGSAERTGTDVALLSASLAQVSAHVDKPHEVKAAAVTGDGDAAAAVGTDLSSLPVIEQRLSELEAKVQQSTARFGDFASALDSIERDLQRYIRRHSLVVENLCPKEDRSASDAFLIFVNCVLGVAVDDSDIDGYHLLDRTSEDGATATNAKSPDKTKDHRPRPLLITFTCYRTRTQVYKVHFSLLMTVHVYIFETGND